MSHKQHVNFQGSTLIFLFCFLSTHECITSEETFDVDTKNLTNVFRKLQSHMHPDKFSLKSEVSYVCISNLPDSLLCFLRLWKHSNHFLFLKYIPLYTYTHIHIHIYIYTYTLYIYIYWYIYIYLYIIHIHCTYNIYIHN